MNLKKILFLILLAAVAVPVAASAQTITGMIANVESIVVSATLYIVIILWIVTGILFLIAQGDPGKLNIAKTALFTSIAGTVIVILAESAQTIIGNSLILGQ